MTETIITGAHGFIGSRLIKRLPESKSLRVENTSYDWVASAVDEADQIFYLSTYGNMAYHADNRMMVRANVIDLLSLLKTFEGWFCYMSSSSVTLPVQTPYSRTKRAAEEILQSLPELKSCIVRPYSVTGVGEQKEHLIPTLIRSCMEGEEMPFDPYPVHDFIDVSDVVNALVMFSEHEHTGVFELGNGIPYTNQSVRILVEELTGKKANVRDCGRLRKYDNDSWCCTKHSISGTKSLHKSISEMVEAYVLNTTKA